MTRMEDNDNNMIDIDELAKKIENRLRELEETQQEEPKKENIDKTIYDFGDLLNQIEAKIKEIEAYEEHKIDIDEVTNRANAKLNYMLEFHDEDEYEKTLYDLEEISQMINDALVKLDKDKLKKQKKAKYCDLARKKMREQQNKYKKSKNYKNKKSQIK